MIRENYRPEKDDYKLDLELDGQLELFSGKHILPGRYPEALGLRHLAFRVEDMDARELNEKGWTQNLSHGPVYRQENDVLS